MAMNVESGFQLSDIGGTLRRRIHVMVWTVLVVAVASYWLAMALPNEYESYGTILVEPQAVSKELVVAGIGATKLTERLGLMTAQILSRPRLSNIIDEFQLYPDESEYMVRQQVIDLMRDAVRVEPIVPELEQRQGGRRRDAEINTFRLYFRYRDAAIAALVAGNLAQDFIDEHIKRRVLQSEKSLDFMSGELGRLAEQIEGIEGNIAEVKSQNSGRLPGEINVNQARLDDLGTQMIYAQRAFAEARSNEEFYRSQQAAAGSMLSPNDDSSPARRMRTLELELAGYEAKGYTAKHPDVLKAQVELVTVRGQISITRDKDEESVAPKTFVQQNADAEVRRSELRRASANAEIARLEEGIAEIRTLLNATPRVAEQLDALERQHAYLFRSYQDFSNRRLEATVQTQLERRQLGEQFRVLEQAFEATEPSSPNRPLIVVLGLFFAVAFAGAVGILMEASDPSIHTPRQLQAALGIPVIGAIPQIWLESDRKQRSRQRIRTVFATSAFVIFGLAGGAVNYLWVNGGLLSGQTAEELPSGEGVTDGGLDGSE